jgi:hypothetical protein
MLLYGTRCVGGPAVAAVFFLEFAEPIKSLTYSTVGVAPQHDFDQPTSGLEFDTAQSGSRRSGSFFLDRTKPTSNLEFDTAQSGSRRSGSFFLDKTKPTSNLEFDSSSYRV